jgi:hypothetical protein
MKRVSKLFAVLAIFAMSGLQAAQELYPVPEVPMSVEHGAFVESTPIPLYTNVKYTDRDEMAPCAVSKIIALKDPCVCRDACDCCGPQCVFIEICVPSCGCELVSCRRNGDRIRYDYGKYAVDVRVKKGFIEVDYQD